MKKIAHLDLNAFFAQCEILKDPSLRGKPMVVGYAGRRGVIATASYEARKLGIHSGQPTSTALKIYPRLIVIDGSYAMYSEKSKEFMSYLRARFPIMEQASIDECYVDMTDYLKDGDDYDKLFDLQMAIYQATQLKCSIGLGSNKFLAKMGSDYKKPLGLTIIDRSHLETILWPIPIEDMFGIGKKTAPRLKALGIETIGDLAKTKDPLVKKVLGNAFEYYQGEANGFGDDVVDTSGFDPKSMSAERTFSEDVSDYDELRSMVSSCCDDIVRELNRYHKETTTVSIKLRTPDFETRSRRRSVKVPIHDKESIFHLAMSVFDDFYQGQPIRLIGVGLEKVQNRKGDDDCGVRTGDIPLEEMNRQLSLGGKIWLGSGLTADKDDED